jgi:diphosphomevalonate decarboxylase
MAHPNVALSKYWGKREGPGNFPAVPSLSVTLDGLSTQAKVTFDEGLPEDVVVINGQVATGLVRERVLRLIDRVRRSAAEDRRVEVVSHNDFPTASGLASSASGFASIALAAASAAKLDWSASVVSDLARRSSGSAARSVFDGYVELEAAPAGAEEELVLAARSVAPVDHWPLVVFVCVTTDRPKAVDSTTGMLETIRRSPYAAGWLEEAPRLHSRLMSALVARDFAATGELAEASFLAMHASAIAAGVLYWNGITLELLGVVRNLRAGGAEVFASVDAGPHVKVFVLESDREKVRSALDSVSGLIRVIEARPGRGAMLLSEPR